jgi:hypothetical protein
MAAGWVTPLEENESLIRPSNLEIKLSSLREQIPEGKGGADLLISRSNPLSGKP